MHRKDEPRTLGACSSDRQKPTSKHGAGAAGLGSRAQLTARWEHAYLRLPGEGRRPGQPHSPHSAQALLFLPLLGRLGAGAGPHRHPRSPGWTLPPLLCFRCPQPGAGNKHPRSPGLCVRAGGGSPAGKAFLLPLGDAWSTAEIPLSSPFFFFSPHICSPRGASCKAPPLPQRGSRDVLEPAPAAPAAGSHSILPHPRALGHNDQVSLSRHQVRGPHPLPCLPEHGKSSSAPKTLPAPWVWHRGLPGGGRSQAQRVRAHTRLPPPPHARTHTPSLPR